MLVNSLVYPIGYKEISMPYIRDKFSVDIKEMLRDSGKLNFVLTQVLLQYVGDNGVSYKTYNDCIGALEACKLEFYRRVVSPYEDKKMLENGDVYK